MPKFTLRSVLALLAFTASSFAADSGQGVKVTQGSDSVKVEINGELFTQYWFKMNQHPAIMTERGITRTNPTKHVYFWPLIGPGGTHMTRGWPMAD